MLRGILYPRFFFQMRGMLHVLQLDFFCWGKTFYIVIIVCGESIFVKGWVLFDLFFIAEGWSVKLRGEYILLSQEGLLKSRVDICFLEVGFLYWGGGSNFLFGGTPRNNDQKPCSIRVACDDDCGWGNWEKPPWCRTQKDWEMFEIENSTETVIGRTGENKSDPVDECLQR